MGILDSEICCRLGSKYTVIPASYVYPGDNLMHTLGEGPATHAIVYRDVVGCQRPVKLIGESTAAYLQASRHGAVSSDLLITSITRNASGHTVAERSLLQLVLEGVLDIDFDGERLSGQVAITRSGIITLPEPESELARISRTAISYVADLGLERPATIESRLYWFNSRPITATREALLGQLLSEMQAEIRRSLGEKWTMPDHKDTGSFTWFDLVNPVFKQYHNEKIYKLYISTRPEALTKQLKHVLEVLRNSRAFEMKIPNHPRALVRPDWFVVYFTNLQDLASVAQELDMVLDGLPAQGVPFTCQVGLGANLSWAMEPPDEIRDGRRHISSWRLWIVQQLASVLAHARETGVDQQVNAAMLRLQIDGVDVSTWAPPQEGWWS